MKKLLGTVLAAGLVATSPAWAGDSLTDQLTAAVKESTVNLSFRYRFEAVDDNAASENAWANTLRTRLTVAPKPISGFGVLLEVDDVRHIGADNFSDTRNGIPTSLRPQVADPKGTDVNQALLRYTGLQDTEITVGRQRIERDNQRFVGGASWRQNEQTFDAVGISHHFGDAVTASYTYIGKVNRIQGPDPGTPPATLGSSSHLMDASYTFGPVATVSAYAYLMEFGNSENLSNETFGLRATGSLDVTEGWKFKYAGGYAHQSDYRDSPVKYDANYYVVEAGLAAERIGVKAGYEVLGGATVAGSAFRTPLGSPHPFQGWADQFTTTPDSGVRDLYVVVTGKALAADLQLWLHDFHTETAGGKLGKEVDFSANWPLAKHYAVLVKGAMYDANGWKTNTNKYWLMLTASF